MGVRGRVYVGMEFSGLQPVSTTYLCRGCIGPNTKYLVVIWNHNGSVILPSAKILHSAVQETPERVILYLCIHINR